MIRFVTLLVLAAFLLVSLIDYMMGNPSHWLSDLGTAFFVAGVVILIFRRKRKDVYVLLPGGEGILTIEEKNYPFLYLVGVTQQGIALRGESEGPDYAVRFTAHIAQEGRIEIDEEEIKRLSQDASVHGIVHFADHRVAMKLRKEPIHCGCESDIPCWRGERYTGVFYERPEMLVQIDCIVIHWRRKQRVPVAHKEEKRFPSLIPPLVPAPSPQMMAPVS